MKMFLSVMVLFIFAVLIKRKLPMILSLILFNIQLISILFKKQQIPELYLRVLLSGQEKGVNFYAILHSFFRTIFIVIKGVSDLANIFLA